MKSPSKFTVTTCGLLLAAGLRMQGQRIAEIDLTRDASAAIHQPDSGPECEGRIFSNSHADGEIVARGDRPKMELRIDSLSSVKPALGAVLEAEITLKNIAKTEITIPWATDPNVANRPPQASHHEFESASFWIRLKDGSGNEELLKSLSLPLYAAQPQNTLTVFPGQWVTMRIKFKLLVDEERPSRSLISGPAELKVEWRQGRFTWDRDGCNINTGYYSYSGFYEQVTDPVKISLLSTLDEEARGSTPH